jgi:hypothetical protein
VDFKSGIGVKHEVSVSAGGDLAPVFAVASGWSAQHLLKPVVVIDQPGLAAGASDARNELPGRLVLRRDGDLSPAEKIQFPGGSVPQSVKFNLNFSVALHRKRWLDARARTHTRTHGWWRCWIKPTMTAARLNH